MSASLTLARPDAGTWPSTFPAACRAILADVLSDGPIEVTVDLDEGPAGKGPSRVAGTGEALTRYGLVLSGAEFAFEDMLAIRIG